MRRLTVLIAITILLAGCSTDALLVDAADTVYTNGKIYTVNVGQPWAEAVAVRDGKFLIVGSSADVQAVTGESTEVVDLKGRFAMPATRLPNRQIRIRPGSVRREAESSSNVLR